LRRQSSIEVNQLHVLNTQKAEPAIGGAGPIDLAKTPLPRERADAQAIAALSGKWCVSMKDIVNVYNAEFDRLAAGARVTEFLIVLALNRTRSILRARRARTTVN
jgi:hypothetical protein